MIKITSKDGGYSYEVAIGQGDLPIIPVVVKHLAQFLSSSMLLLVHTLVQTPVN